MHTSPLPPQQQALKTSNFSQRHFRQVNHAFTGLTTQDIKQDLERKRWGNPYLDAQHLAQWAF